MNPKKYSFSTPLVNPDCPFGLPNPVVAVTATREWEKGQSFEMDSDLDRWMHKQKFGELVSNFYQADHSELMSCEAITLFLESKGMKHDPTLDAELIESFEP